MTPLLAIDFDPAVLEKLGLVGLLLCAVYFLAKFAMKSVADKDATIVRGQEREREHVKERDTLASAVETLAESNKTLAAAFQGMRERMVEHEARCGARRGAGAADVAA